MAEGHAESYANMEKLSEYIDQMKLKKSFNGFNCADVYKKMMDMQDIFQQYMDQYEEILSEKNAHISELSSRVHNLKENYREKLLKKDTLINGLRLKLDEKTELTIKLYRELNEYSEQLKKYKEREQADLDNANENIQQANATARLIIEQAKIDAEVESLKFYEKQNAEKEKYKKWRQHTETASHEVLDNLRRIEEYITKLDDKLVDKEKIAEEEEIEAI